VHLVGLVLLVGAGFEEKSNHVEMSLVAGESQCTFFELVRVGVDAGSVVEKDLE
jgi:hypothetical protein